MIGPRKTVSEMEAYRPPLERRRGKVRLDFNENTDAVLPPGIGLSFEEISAYPEYDPFVEACSKWLNIKPETMLPVNGSGEALMLLAFTFIEPCIDSAVTSSPTFALIPHYLKMAGARVTEVSATQDLEFDIDGIEKALSGGPKIAVFASPDNPTGALLPPDTVRRWCDAFKETLFVIDCAYSEYSHRLPVETADMPENLVILKTFSKAWGMAGLRLGLILGDPRLMSFIRRVRPPYSVNSAALAAAIPLMASFEKVNKGAVALMARKDELIKKVGARGFIVRSGSANFFLLKAGIDAGRLCGFFRSEGILLRDQTGKHLMDGIVRVTVGTGSENNAFIECLDRFRKRRAIVFDMDDTLVDTSESFGFAVRSLVEKYSGRPFNEAELTKLKESGGFNDDWDTAFELIIRAGRSVIKEQIESEGVGIYLSVAKERERLMINEALLKVLSKRYRLFVSTGRRRAEYDPIWSDRLDRFFEKVYCRDDFPDLPPKPAPDSVARLMKKHGISGGFYVGNSVDDMRAAAGAGLTPIGIAATSASEKLREAGAEITIDSIEDLRKVFMI